MSDDWRVRRFRAGDEAGIRRLLERGFDRRLDEPAWRWKLRQRPSPTDNVWLAVDRDDRPVFHYGGIPRTLELAGRPREVMIAVDSVTDPAFRRRGLLTAGVRAAHRAWAAAGIACVLGLPNEQWGSRVRAVGWRRLFPLTWLIRPLRPERLLARRLGLPALDRLTSVGRMWRSLAGWRPDPSLQIREVERAGGEVAALVEAGATADLLMLSRDPNWLDWRYSSCPIHRYRMIVVNRAGRLAGYLVYRFDRESRFGFIAEILTRPDDEPARRALAAAAADRLLAAGADAVAALAVPGSALHRSLRRARFLPRRKSFAVHCVPLAGDLAAETLRGSRRWWLQGGDFDVI